MGERDPNAMHAERPIERGGASCEVCEERDTAT